MWWREWYVTGVAPLLAFQAVSCEFPVCLPLLLMKYPSRMYAHRWASLSGIPLKLALIEDHETFRPARAKELSTHIGKFLSPRHEDLIANEYLTTMALKTLLPDDPIVDLHMGRIEGFPDQAQWVKRLETEHRRAVELVGETMDRVRRLYLAASAQWFRMGCLNVYQTMLTKSSNGQSGLPSRARIGMGLLHHRGQVTSQLPRLRVPRRFLLGHLSVVRRSILH